MNMRQRIAALKEAGISNSAIAFAVGCHEAYVRSAIARTKNPHLAAEQSRRVYWRDHEKSKAWHRNRYRQRNNKAASAA